jgi:secreted trypsin-like serine protease
MKAKKLILCSLFLSVASNAQVIADSGYQSGTVRPLVVGGDTAPANSYPWMTAILDKTNKKRFCGGSLIADQWVLTAAHCVEGADPNYIQVYIGGVDLTDFSGGELRDVRRIYSHEDYNSEDNNNDIALLKLNTSSSKSPIELASAQLDDSLAVGTSLYTAGWGATNNDPNNRGTDVLMHVEVPLRSHEECNTNYKQQYNLKITDNMVCAGDAEGTRDSCTGDSGGPLVVPEGSNNYKLLGINSFGGSPCADGKHPGVYARASRYHDWIAGKLNGTTTPDIVASPTYVFFGMTGVGLESTREVTLANDSDSPVLIQSTILDGDPGLSVKSDNCQQKVLEANQQCSVVISFSSPEVGEKAAKLSFETSSTKNSTISVEAVAEALPKVDLGRALDNSSLAWFSSSEIPWEAVCDKNYVNGSAAKSGSVQNNQLSFLVTQVTGPGTITFRWKSSPNAEDDFVMFHIDAEQMAIIDGEPDWTTLTKEIPAGTHELTWAYGRYEGTTTNSYTGLLDDVQINVDVPSQPPTQAPSQEPTNSSDFIFSCNESNDCHKQLSIKEFLTGDGD